MPAATWPRVCAHRLAAHALDRPAAGLVDVVRAICGVHAQVASAAELSIGIRVAGITRDDVRDALWQQRSLVRTYGPRGTVHLLPADELGMWLAALATAPRAEPRIPPEVGMNDDQLAAVLDAIGTALAGRDALTWRELGDEVVRRTGRWAGEEVFPAFGELWPRWRPAISTAASRGLLCFGPNRGNQVTYLRPDRWLGGFAMPDDGRAALATVALRYLTAYGPATAADLARWLGILPDAAAALFETLDLTKVDVEGHPAWLPSGVDLPAAKPRGVRLLPHFDAYVIGCQPRARVFPGAAAERALSRGSAGQVPVLLVDGVVAGTWQHRRSGRRVQLTVEPFGAFRRRRELDRQAERMAEIMQATLDLAVGPVAARPHR
ncbi:MAG TPA: winged helix DNA-binding domain-containing protein [Pseudonocardiaceae bacterium]|jgi:hypothetical protein